jgi:uncharacterized protein (TIGR02466 family)
MKQPPPPNNCELNGLFPTPLYVAKRDSNLDSIEEKEIENIIKEGLDHLADVHSGGNSQSMNKYIFNDNLKNIKQFCDLQIQGYIERVINPKEKLDFYITQSWLNITKPGGFHHEHLHSNSILSGVFYISTQKGDSISIIDPNANIKESIIFAPKEYNMWNSCTTHIPISPGELVIFPSWLRHSVQPNEKATKDRISLSFNTFVKGTIGDRQDLTELIL